jgi:hypothetical protein
MVLLLSIKKVKKRKKMKRIFWAFILLIAPVSLHAVKNPVYICTASDENYFPCLVNLIGSLHQHNFDEIQQIAVFNLGLNQQQLEYLATIENVAVYSIERTHPDLLKRFNTRTWGKPVPGWYAWKPVILKQAFDLFGHNATIFWIDAGTTIYRNLGDLFAYTQEHGYFFHNGSPWPLNKETTQFVKNAFNLTNEQNSWMLDDSCKGLEAGFMGVTNKVYDTFVLPMYELTKDLRYFADDGTCPGGFGNSRHDISLFSIHAFMNGYTIFQHFEHPTDLMYLEVAGIKVPFHIACNPEDRIDQTHIYCARFDVNPSAYAPFIQYKKKELPQNQFVVIIPSYNNEEWYFKNLSSVLTQKYPHYRIIYIDDVSTDNTLQCVKDFIAQFDQDKKITLIANQQKQGALANFYYAIHSCQPHEIIVMLDGDDWLADENTLSILDAAYKDPNVWITYGQFKEYPSGRLGGARQLPAQVIAQRAYREYDWVTTHLRTFYAFLFHKIKREDLMYKGDFFPMAWDLAIMFPILEMAGEHSKFISDILYIYNRATPINDNKVNVQLQMFLDQTIHKMAKYQPL